MSQDDIDSFYGAMQNRLTDPALSAEELTRLEKASAIFRDSVEAKKLAAEAAKLRDESDNFQRTTKSESIRFWVPVLAPVVGALALVLTLAFQIHQFNENSRLARETNEASQFRLALQGANIPSGLSEKVNEARLKTFLHSPTLGDQAKEMIVTMLPAISDEDSFQDLFSATFPEPKYSDLPELVRLTKLIRTEDNLASEALQRAEKAKAAASASGSRSSANPYAMGPFQYQSASLGPYARPGQSPQDAIDGINASRTTLDDHEEPIVDKRIAQVLALRPPAESPDLTLFDAYHADFRGTNFGPARLNGAYIQYCDVRDADLSQIKDGAFADSLWTGTAWWRATSISRPLFMFLKSKFPYDRSVKYFGDPASSREYGDALKRLAT